MDDRKGLVILDEVNNFEGFGDIHNKNLGKLKEQLEGLK